MADEVQNVVNSDSLEASGWGRNIKMVTQSAPITKLYPILLIFEIFAFIGSQQLIGVIVGAITVLCSIGIVIFLPDRTWTETTFLAYKKMIGDKLNPTEEIDSQPSRPVFQKLSVKQFKVSFDKKKL